MNLNLLLKNTNYVLEELFMKFIDYINYSNETTDALEILDMVHRLMHLILDQIVYSQKSSRLIPFHFMVYEDICSYSYLMNQIDLLEHLNQFDCSITNFF